MYSFVHNTRALACVTAPAIVPEAEAAPAATRRATLLMGVTALTAVAVPTLAKAADGLPASPQGDDAELLRLHALILDQSARHEAAHFAYDRLLDLSWASTEVFKPRYRAGDPVPQVRMWCQADQKDVLYCNPFYIERDRSRTFGSHKARERFAEILAEHDEYESVYAEVELKLGLKAARAKSDQEFEKYRDLMIKMTEMRASTIEGLRAKASIIFGVCWNGSFDDVEIGGASDEKLTHSILVDLIGRVSAGECSIPQGSVALTTASRRGLLMGFASAVTVPAPALAAAIGGLPASLDDDAELLALTVSFDPLFESWRNMFVQQGTDVEEFEKYLQRKAGMSRAEADRLDRHSPEYAAYHRILDECIYDRRGEGSDHYDSEAWEPVSDRFYDIANEILSYRASTREGLALQVRAFISSYSEVWEDDHGARDFVECVCDFAGVPFPPTEAATLDLDVSASETSIPDGSHVLALPSQPAPELHPERTPFPPKVHPRRFPKLRHKQPKRPKSNNIDPSKLPTQYALQVDGTCMEPLIPDGTIVRFSKTEKWKAGDIVCFWTHPDHVPPGEHQCNVKRVVHGISEFPKLPYKTHPESQVVSLLVVEALNPPRKFCVGYDKILAVHKMVGTQAPSGKPIPVKEFKFEAPGRA